MKYKAVFVDVLNGDIELDTCDTKEEAEKAISKHKEKSRAMASLNPFASFAYSNKYRVDNIYEGDEE